LINFEKASYPSKAMGIEMSSNKLLNGHPVPNRGHFETPMDSIAFNHPSTPPSLTHSIQQRCS